MKEKFFSFNVVADDPKPLNMEVSTEVFLVKNREISKPSNVNVVDFDPEDIIYFDDDFGGTLNISFNDLMHGKYNIEEKEFDIKDDDVFIVKKITYIDIRNREKNTLFKIDKLKEGIKETVYVDNRYFLKPWKHRVRVITEILDIDEQALKDIIGL